MKKYILFLLGMAFFIPSLSFAQEIKVGDEIMVHGLDTVVVKNPELLNIDGFSQFLLESKVCVISTFSTVTVIGKEGKNNFLVRYRTPSSRLFKSEVSCPSGVVFSLSKKQIAKMVNLDE